MRGTKLFSIIQYRVLPTRVIGSKTADRIVEEEVHTKRKGRNNPE